MNDRFYNSMGLCRRAGKLAIGHDDVKNTVKNGKAKIILITSDASQRIEEEMRNLTDSAEIIRIDASMDDMKDQVGRHSGVFSVTDKGLEDLVLSTLKEDSIHGTNQ